MSTGRVSSREADRRPSAPSRRRRRRGARPRQSDPAPGSGGKSSALERADVEGRVSGNELDVLLGGAKLERDASRPAASRTTSSNRRAGRTTVPSRTTSASSGTRRPTSISVARARSRRTTRGAGRPTEPGSRCASRRRCSTVWSCRSRALAVAGDLHDEYLRRDLEVIGDLKVLTTARNARSEARNSWGVQETDKCVNSGGRYGRGR